jgi:hypothetical protein
MLIKIENKNMGITLAAMPMPIIASDLLIL